MLITPRYDGPPLLAIDGPAEDVHEPLLRQRRRMELVLERLTDEQWKSASRCDGWSVQDVIAHLIGTNRFWSGSIIAGLAGSPTRVLVGFDPAATPSLMVEPMRSMSPAETLEQFVDSNRGIFDAVESLDHAGWSTLAESPVGHVSVRLVANHALWDAWIHERDIVLPLGLAPTEEVDEVVACLRYAAAIGPTFVLSRDPDRRGALVVVATEPDVRFVIDVGSTVDVHDGEPPDDAARVAGRAVDLVESLSIRAPLVRSADAASQWLFDGLADVFDTVSAG